MYVILKDEGEIGRFIHVRILESGVLEATNDPHKGRIELFLQMHQWDSVFHEDSHGNHDIIDLQWGVEMPASDGHGRVVVTLTDKHAAHTYARENGGDLVHRQVGPWIRTE